MGIGIPQHGIGQGGAQQLSPPSQQLHGIFQTGKKQQRWQRLQRLKRQPSMQYGLKALY
jgi:hypothetical protein